MSFAGDFVDFRMIGDLLILGLLVFFAIFQFSIFHYAGPSLFSSDLSWCPFAVSIWLSSFGIVLFSSILSGMEWTWLSLLFLSLGGSGVLSHRACSGTVFSLSIPYCRDAFSDVGGLTLAQGGKGSYISF